MNIEQMTEALQAIIMRALSKAQENHHSEVTIEHILLAMVFGWDLDAFKY